MADLKIRKIENSDLERVAVVLVKAFNNAGENWTIEIALKHVKESVFGDFCHYVAVINDKIVGFIIAFPITRVEGVELFVDTIATDPDFQKKGIGKALIDKAFAYAKDNQLVALSLHSKPTMESFKWYRRLGLEESGWVELFKRI